MTDFRQASPDIFDVLLQAATRAPSGDNTQPWRFATDHEAGRLVIHVDGSRDPSPMNAGNRMARIAVGAALENILRMVRSNGLDAKVETLGGEGVAVRISGTVAGPLQIEAAINNRCTNRKLYDNRRLSTDLQERLQVEASDQWNAVRTSWVTDPASTETIANIIRRSDTLMFGNSSLRNAFFKNVRFDAAGNEPVEEGLSLGSLEVNGAERLVFRLLPIFPDGIARLLRVGETIGQQSEKLVRSASGVCVGFAQDNEPATDFIVGRAMQRAWLALTERGLSAQPIMSLAVLENVLQHGCDELRQALGVERVTALGQELRRLGLCHGTERVGFLLRFGFAVSPPTLTSARLPVERVKC